MTEDKLGEFNDTLDLIETKKWRKKRVWKLLALFIGFGVSNSFYGQFFIFKDQNAPLLMSMFAFIIFFFAVATVLSIPFSFIPFKGEQYKHKYLPTTFFIAWVLSLMITGLILYEITKTFVNSLNG